jgi:hypothetical protein
MQSEGEERIKINSHQKPYFETLAKELWHGIEKEVIERLQSNGYSMECGKGIHYYTELVQHLTSVETMYDYIVSSTDVSTHGQGVIYSKKHVLIKENGCLEEIIKKYELCEGCTITGVAKLYKTFGTPRITTPFCHEAHVRDLIITWIGDNPGVLTTWGERDATNEWFNSWMSSEFDDDFPATERNKFAARFRAFIVSTDSFAFENIDEYEPMVCEWIKEKDLEREKKAQLVVLNNLPSDIIDECLRKKKLSFNDSERLEFIDFLCTRNSRKEVPAFELSGIVSKGIESFFRLNYKRT